jgi:hypothetical protein
MDRQRRKWLKTSAVAGALARGSLPAKAARDEVLFAQVV